MNFKPINFYDFDFKAVFKAFEGTLTFINTIYIPQIGVCAVFHNSTPNRDKQHKDYLLLTNKFVTGLDKEDMEKYRYQDGLLCNSCKDIIFSVHRHDFRYCTCGKVAIDGGKDYTKISGNSGDYTTLTLDLLTCKVKE